MTFNAFRENKIFAKISEFTVFHADIKWRFAAWSFVTRIYMLVGELSCLNKNSKMILCLHSVQGFFLLCIEEIGEYLLFIIYLHKLN